VIFFRELDRLNYQGKTGHSESTFGDIYGKKSEKNSRYLSHGNQTCPTHYRRGFLYSSIHRASAWPTLSGYRCRYRSSCRQAERTWRYLYVDGGVLANYPVKLFDREKYLFKGRE